MIPNFNPFKLNGLSHSNSLDSPFPFKGCKVLFISIFIQILIENSVSKL